MSNYAEPATTSLLIQEWSDPDENDGKWPYPTEYKKYLIGGALADRIRERLEDVGPVYITEELVSGGWSEWTIEEDMFFTVECGASRVQFDEYTPKVDYGTTTVARLQAWLEGVSS